ncbi:MAG: beta-lactamase family protein [Alphaproteobacteria bacterium]|nr:beta-lactamase family protein [Alphaproteobacteria bacterium]
MTKLFDTYNASFAALDGKLPQQQDLKTTTRDREWLTGRVTASAVAMARSNGEISKRSGGEEVFCIASITKTFAAVAITKVATSPEFSSYFDNDDPLGTKISVFESLVAKHGSENERRYIEELKTIHPHYAKITLRHLLNHTSGIGHPSFFDEFRADQSKSFRFDDGKYFSPVVGNLGEHSYSDTGYEIAALMTKVVVSE